MLFRDNYFFKHKHKLVKVSIASDKWNHDFNKTLIIPKKTTEKELKEILEQSLGPVEIISIIEERVLCLINQKKKWYDEMKKILLMMSGKMVLNLVLLYIFQERKQLIFQ